MKRLAQPQMAPGGATPAQIRHGFQQYDAHCVMCHGGPGVPRARWVRGLLPTPPFLLDAPRRWTPAQLDFIVSHGIKMTAMPAWSLSQPRGDLADIVRFLEQLPNISPQQYRAMRQAQHARPRNDNTATEASNR